MSSDNYQATLEAALHVYTRGFVVFTLAGVPLAFFAGPNWLSMLIGVLVCLGAVVQLAFQWAVYS